MTPHMLFVIPGIQYLLDTLSLFITSAVPCRVVPSLPSHLSDHSIRVFSNKELPRLVEQDDEGAKSEREEPMLNRDGQSSEDGV